MDTEKYKQLKAALAGNSVGNKLGAVTGGKKKGGGGFYSEKWAPPHRHGDENPDAEPIALIKGSYVVKAKTVDGEQLDVEYPFWVCFDHYNASKGVKRRSCVCSAGMVVDLNDQGQAEYKTGSEPCIPCHYIDEEGANEYISRSRKTVFTGVILKWFHVKKVENKTVFAACKRKNCELCAQGEKRQFGRRVFWPMGPIWTEYILQKNAVLQKSCGCGGALTYLGFTCPECTAIIKDYEERNPKEGEIEHLRTTEVKCPKCKTKVLAVAEVECDECDEPVLVDLWSVILKPIRIGEKYTPDLEQWRPLKEKEIEALANFKPINFEKFLSPAPLDDQSKWFGLKNPFNGVEDDDDDEGASEWDD